MRTVAKAESKRRVQALKKRGLRTKTITLPNGEQVVLTSKRAFVCRVHHCTLKPVQPKASAARVPAPPKKPKKRKKR